mmetsp:Transcript_57039/g.83455  ORF Transcript_57039/g.83455 Transcript_57039/m.83455 type:complete len:130 (+) Transcript_57039:1014-1403(+)
MIKTAPSASPGLHKRPPHGKRGMSHLVSERVGDVPVANPCKTQKAPQITVGVLWRPLYCPPFSLCTTLKRVRSSVYNRYRRASLTRWGMLWTKNSKWGGDEMPPLLHPRLEAHMAGGFTVRDCKEGLIG